MLRRTITVAVVALVPLATACAADPESVLTPDQTAMIQATCTKVMRLEEGQAQFEGCVSSLSDTMTQEVRYARAASAYRNCEHDGLVAGTPQLSRCVLDGEDSAKGTGFLQASLVSAADNDPRSYFSVSFKTRHRREEYACANLGLTPETSSFIGCVNRLDTDLFNIDVPNG